MTELWNGGIQLLHLSEVYYATQLIRCAVLSMAVFAGVMVLRETVLKNHIFFKGALWSLLLPVPFAGRMRFFYENSIGRALFSWLTELCMNHLWICRLYLCGVLVYAAFLAKNRRAWNKLAAGMKRTPADGTWIYISEFPVTPSAAGVFRPKIVMPEAILKAYSQEEIRTILLHERTHIRLGHLLLYLLWDILRALLWLNPLLTIGTRLFREDLEDICDRITIQKSGGDAYTYGRLLVKSMRFLQEERESPPMYAAFVREREYQSIRRRLNRISGYRPYSQITAAGALITAMLCAAGIFLYTQHISYGRYTPSDRIAVYDTGTKTMHIRDNAAFAEMLSYDEQYIYIEPNAFGSFIEGSGLSGETVYIYFDGFYKLPGIGGGGGTGVLETSDLGKDTLQIAYTASDDIFCQILKIL